MSVGRGGEHLSSDRRTSGNARRLIIPNSDDHGRSFGSVGTFFQRKPILVWSWCASGSACHLTDETVLAPCAFSVVRFLSSEYRRTGRPNPVAPVIHIDHNSTLEAKIARLWAARGVGIPAC